MPGAILQPGFPPLLLTIFPGEELSSLVLIQEPRLSCSNGPCSFLFFIHPMLIPETSKHESGTLPCTVQELHSLITPVLFALVVVHW